MIEKILTGYTEIDEYSDFYTRMITAVVKEAERNKKFQKKKKMRRWWPWDELVPPVISPERYWKF